MKRIEACEFFNQAFERLKEVLNLEKNDVTRDSTIKRFELCTDLVWKYLKIHLEEDHGILAASPKKVIREAYRVGLIEYEDAWIKIIDWRNQSAHIYQEELDEGLYAWIPNAVKLFQHVSDRVLP